MDYFNPVSSIHSIIHVNHRTIICLLSVYTTQYGIRSLRYTGTNLWNSLSWQDKDKTRDKTFIIIILQEQFFGTHLARKCYSRRAKLILLQIRYYIIISKKQRKKKEEICVMNSKARKTNLFNAACEIGYGLGFRDFISRVIMVASR